MSNYNKVLLMGRLTKDPELRYTPQGTAVTDVGLAVNREFKPGGGGGEGESRKETTFVDVTFWARQAEVVCQYLNKGSPLFIEGRLSLDSWESPDGQKRSRLKVVGENFRFLGGGRGESAGGGSRDESNYGSNFRSGDAAPAPSGSQAANAEAEGNPLGVDDSDIPF